MCCFVLYHFVLFTGGSLSLNPVLALQQLCTLCTFISSPRQYTIFIGYTVLDNDRRSSQTNIFYTLFAILFFLWWGVHSIFWGDINPSVQPRHYTPSTMYLDSSRSFISVHLCFLGPPQRHLLWIPPRASLFSSIHSSRSFVSLLHLRTSMVLRSSSKSSSHIFFGFLFGVVLENLICNFIL